MEAVEKGQSSTTPSHADPMRKSRHLGIHLALGVATPEFDEFEVGSVANKRHCHSSVICGCNNDIISAGPITKGEERAFLFGNCFTFSCFSSVHARHGSGLPRCFQTRRALDSVKTVCTVLTREAWRRGVSGVLLNSLGFGGAATWPINVDDDERGKNLKLEYQ